jgi:hypothetical protein
VPTEIVDSDVHNTPATNRVSVKDGDVVLELG